VPLREIIQQLRSNALPEESPYLVVEGDLVQVQFGIDGQYFWYCEQDDEKSVFGGLANFDFQPLCTPSKSSILLTSHTADHEASGSVKDALILIDWHESRGKGKHGMVVMLLTWVTNDVAERKGQLYDPYLGD
jgi:hypothetical protein